MSGTSLRTNFIQAMAMTQEVKREMAVKMAAAKQQTGAVKRTPLSLEDLQRSCSAAPGYTQNVIRSNTQMQKTAMVPAAHKSRSM